MLRLGGDIRKAFDTPDFRFTISSAATLSPGLWTDFQEKTGKKVVNLNGLSETGNNLFAGPDAESHRIGSIGKPVDCSVLIVNEQKEEVPTGDIGELLIDCRSTSHYLDAQSATCTIDAVQWFATGDLGHVDANGIYWLSARKKSIIIVGGRNVYPDEITNVLLSHPGVIEAATFGMPDDLWDERVVSCAVVKNGITTQELLDFSAQYLSDYKVPREIHLLPELPKGRSGKVLIHELILRLQRGAPAPVEDHGQNLEEQVLHLASESFRVSPGELSLNTTPQTCSRWDSVAHMDFIVNVESRFGIELLPREVIQITSLDAAVRILRKKLT